MTDYGYEWNLIESTGRAYDSPFDLDYLTKSAQLIWLAQFLSHGEHIIPSSVRAKKVSLSSFDGELESCLPSLLKALERAALGADS